MFHWTNNIYFGRLPDGSVRLLVLPVSPESFPEVTRAYRGSTLDVTIPAAEWASIQAAVSARGEVGEVYMEAVRLHSTEKAPPPVHHQVELSDSVDQVDRLG